jgi:hypothetical protein
MRGSTRFGSGAGSTFGSGFGSDSLAFGRSAITAVFIRGSTRFGSGAGSAFGSGFGSGLGSGAGAGAGGSAFTGSGFFTSAFAGAAAAPAATPRKRSAAAPPDAVALGVAFAASGGGVDAGLGGMFGVNACGVPRRPSAGFAAATGAAAAATTGAAAAGFGAGVAAFSIGGRVGSLNCPLITHRSYVGSAIFFSPIVISNGPIDSFRASPKIGTTMRRSNEPTTLSEISRAYLLRALAEHAAN